MPNFSGLWTPSQHLQAKSSNIWPSVPGTPTIGTITATSTTVTIPFTAPADPGYPGITSYTATLSPGGATATVIQSGSGSIVVTGLTALTAYTVSLIATNATGNSAAATGSITTTAPPEYVEDVFSTSLYSGTNSTIAINNGVDLSTKGGLVWIKARNGAIGQRLYDTVRGGAFQLGTQETTAQATNAGTITFNSNGFSTQASTENSNNQSVYNYVAWTFRKAPKFFDIVTYTGNGTATNTISHNLQSVPGVIIAKRLDSTSAWVTVARYSDTNWLGGNAGSGAGYSFALNTTDAAGAGVSPTDRQLTTTTFNAARLAGTLASFETTAANVNGATYVAYLFAHNAGGFGVSGNENIISCGSYTGTGVNDNKITLGFEPQYLIIKPAVVTGRNWMCFDDMRGLVHNGNDEILWPNLVTAASPSGYILNPLSDGFSVGGSDIEINRSGDAYIYIAIRRPMKVPTLGTTVYRSISRTGTGSATAVLNTGITTDMLIQQARAGDGYGNRITSRLQGNKNMILSRDEAESGVYSANSEPGGWDVQTGVRIGNANNGWDQGGTTFANHAFKRAPGFFDVVTYTGDGAYNRPMNHNLGVVPELIIFKNRSSAGVNWVVYHASLGGAPPSSQNYLYLNTTDNGTQTAYQPMDGLPTNTQLILRPSGSANASGSTYVVFLFASCPGVSKVGTYTGNGSAQTIPCGFSTGARFIMIKRTDAAGDWYVWDSVRGIVAANEPHLSFNTMVAEVSDDSVDPDNSGFIVNQIAGTNINVSTANYVFLAIA